jgi:hypothetical protein
MKGRALGGDAEIAVASDVQGIDGGTQVEQAANARDVAISRELGE